MEFNVTASCFICNKKVDVLPKYNLKHHNLTKHAELSMLGMRERTGLNLYSYNILLLKKNNTIEGLFLNGLLVENKAVLFTFVFNL